MAMSKTGTKEWSEESRNIQLGCERGCIYCYGCEGALRFRRINSRAEWLKPKINQRALKNTGKVEGVIMFPSTHDITKLNIDYALVFLDDLLANGNRVLIVSKPEKAIIDRLTYNLAKYKAQMKFRFTIGSADDSVLKFWEPNAPAYWERVDSLRLCFERGFQTSVSCEPYLDDTIFSLVNEVSQYVTDTIWIGRLNKFERRVDTKGWGDREWAFANRMFAVQSHDAVWQLYEHFKNNPKIRWKDSCKKVLGIPEEAIG
jgi:DNA repair photolyase